MRDKDGKTVLNKKESKRLDDLMHRKVVIKDNESADRLLEIMNGKNKGVTVVFVGRGVRAGKTYLMDKIMEAADKSIEDIKTAGVTLDEDYKKKMLSFKLYEERGITIDTRTLDEMSELGYVNELAEYVTKLPELSVAEPFNKKYDQEWHEEFFDDTHTCRKCKLDFYDCVCFDNPMDKRRFLRALHNYWFR